MQDEIEYLLSRKKNLLEKFTPGADKKSEGSEGWPEDAEDSDIPVHEKRAKDKKVREI
ncbi:hypothetical protein HYU14_03855 [Candidatus Woesearchaeota archaeon]|nr:hypothetical protein [Candidatus Woesearchaeota archaeon]